METRAVRLLKLGVKLHSGRWIKCESLQDESLRKVLVQAVGARNTIDYGEHPEREVG